MQKILVIILSSIFIFASCKQEETDIILLSKPLTDSTSIIIRLDRVDSIYSLQSYKRDELDGPALFINSKHVLVDYKYYDIGHLRYYRRYNEKGIVRSYDGFPILGIDTVIYVEPPKDTTKELVIKLKYISPPKTKFRAMICDCDKKDGSSIDNSCFWCKEIKNTDSIQCDFFYKNGYKKKLIYWSLEDTTNGDIQKNTIYIQIEPINNN